jgi:hypothetical protein
MNDEQRAKDEFFLRVGALADEMVKAHGEDFAMGVLVLAARWIAEGKSFAPITPKRSTE